MTRPDLARDVRPGNMLDFSGDTPTTRPDLAKNVPSLNKPDFAGDTPMTRPDLAKTVQHLNELDLAVAEPPSTRLDHLEDTQTPLTRTDLANVGPGFSAPPDSQNVVQETECSAKFAASAKAANEAQSANKSWVIEAVQKATNEAVQKVTNAAGTTAPLLEMTHPATATSKRSWAAFTDNP